MSRIWFPAGARHFILKTARRYREAGWRDEAAALRMAAPFAAESSMSLRALFRATLSLDPVEEIPRDFARSCYRPRTVFTPRARRAA